MVVDTICTFVGTISNISTAGCTPNPISLKRLLKRPGTGVGTL